MNAKVLASLIARTFKWFLNRSILLPVQVFEPERRQKHEQQGKHRQHAEADERVQREQFLVEEHGRPVVEPRRIAEYGDAPGAGRYVAEQPRRPIEGEQAVAEHHLFDDDKQHGQNRALRFFQKRRDEQPDGHRGYVRQRHRAVCAQVTRGGRGERKVDKQQGAAEQNTALHDADDGEDGELLRARTPKYPARRTPRARARRAPCRFRGSC